MRPLESKQAVIAAFKGEPAKMVADLFAFSKAGRTWFGLNPDLAAEALGQERKRIVKALEVMEERGLIELRVSDSRQRYTLLQPDADPDELAQEMAQKFAKRETQEIARLRQVLELVTHAGCQTNAPRRLFRRGANRAVRALQFLRHRQAAGSAARPCPEAAAAGLRRRSV